VIIEIPVYRGLRPDQKPTGRLVVNDADTSSVVHSLIRVGIGAVVVSFERIGWFAENIVNDRQDFPWRAAQRGEFQNEVPDLVFGHPLMLHIGYARGLIQLNTRPGSGFGPPLKPIGLLEFSCAALAFRLKSLHGEVRLIWFLLLSSL
jgi:hypothetical protein